MNYIHYIKFGCIFHIHIIILFLDSNGFAKSKTRIRQCRNEFTSIHFNSFFELSNIITLYYYRTLHMTGCKLSHEFPNVTA